MKKIKVLVADDAVFIREMIKKYLDPEKFEIIEAQNGVEAVKMYETHNPYIVSMDITMPDMNGKQALKKIKEYDKTANVMMSTALGQESHLKECFLYGCNIYLLKPYTKEAYLEKIDELIKRGIMAKKCPYDKECEDCLYRDICRIEK